ncbi:unnamed protein product [Protopolystoma xenopodis]|uniref:Uncharacterized protein n=1 Tax=Protopolystoma xenopodis TaxID=117903 RepID=A0A3S5AP12_9PLAT|nr:unnamed protein product [Protopolystoma xenopodis]
MMIRCSDGVHHMTDESLAPFHRNRRRLLWKQRQHECSSKANRQLVKRNLPSASGGTDLRISSPNTSTRNEKYFLSFFDKSPYLSITVRFVSHKTFPSAFLRCQQGTLNQVHSTGNKLQKSSSPQLSDSERQADRENEVTGPLSCSSDMVVQRDESLSMAPIYPDGEAHHLNQSTSILVGPYEAVSVSGAIVCRIQLNLGMQDG